MNKEYNSPFAYRPETSIVLRKDSSKGISSERMQKLWETGVLTEEDITIIEVLHNMLFLTAKMIQDAFESGVVPEDLMRIPGSKETNPYKKSLLKLEHYGIALVYSFFNGNNIVGSKIYTLSKGADKWIENLSTAGHKYFLKNIPYNFKLPEKKIEYLYILSILAGNHFHIKTVKEHKEQLLAYFPVALTENFNAYIYQLIHDRCIIMMPLRGPLFSFQSHEKIMAEIIGKLNKYHMLTSAIVLLINTDTLEASGQINAFIKSNELFKDIHFLYITDFSVFHEPDPFKSVIFYPGAESNKYSRAEINIT